MFQTDHIKLTAILRIAIGWKTNPKQYGSVLIMKKPIFIDLVTNLRKIEPIESCTPLVLTDAHEEFEFKYTKAKMLSIR